MASADDDRQEQGYYLREREPHQSPRTETGLRASLSECVTGRGAPQQPGARGSIGIPRESDSLLQNQKSSSKRSLVVTICSYTFLVLLLIVLVVAGSTLLFQPSSDSKEGAKELIAYERDTVYLAEVSETNYKVTVQQLCSGGGNHIVELYLAPNCDLRPHCSNIHSEVTTVNSTISPTVTEVQFNGQSHIYMVSGSNITFSVEISTPMARTSLVIFDNYTYYTDFEHSPDPSTDNALLVYVFGKQKSSYSFYGETDTYFVAFETLSNINFTFHYSGYVCNYSHLDYKKSECDLPASTCQQKICSFEHQPHNKTCVLSYVPQSETHPTFARSLVKAYWRVPTSKQRTLGIALLSLTIVPIALLLCVTVVVVTLCCRKKSRTRPPQATINN